MTKSLYNEIVTFILKHRNDYCFSDWHENCYKHTTSIVASHINGYLFISRSPIDGAIQGFGMCHPMSDANEFYVNQLIATNREARRDLIKQFFTAYPNATIKQAARRGKLKDYKHSETFVKRFTNI